ncbi:importin-13 isoform X2 [Brachyhypopomus gauderio]|uniref:importin-13 isoform X2 n=1 Tax=Brachyhypopomus gauderio TaxID=698409 RepID=UPI004042AEF5
MSADLVQLSDSAEFTVDAVERALQQLYYDPDMAQKSVAQKWLTRAQASPQAWHFSWALLSPGKVPEIQFFGASTLHTKITLQWSDLPHEQRESLRSQLVAQVIQFACGPKMVLTRLSVALASLILHAVQDSWPTAVPDILLAFQSRDGGAAEADARRLALLEVLTVLPEELQSRGLPLERQAQLRAALAGEWSSLCPVLHLLLGQEGGEGRAKERALRCVASWLALDVDMSKSEDLLQDSFALLKEPRLFDVAVETIVSALSTRDYQRFADTLLKITPLVLGLQEQLKTAVEDRDMETSHGICRIAVALGETHCKTLLEKVEHWQGFQALVSMILSCTSIPGHYPVDETSSSLTLTFWYTLQDDISSLDREKQTFYLRIYRPVYLQLVDILLQKARFPSEEGHTSWSADDKEQFRTYRVDISDTLMYVYELLGPELLRNLYDKLGALLTDKTLSSSWQDIEALLFGFQSVAETVDVGYSDVIPGLIGLIPLITANNIQLAETIMLTIGSLAEWLADHSLLLPTVLHMVLQALSRADLSVATVSTLKRLCRECRCDLCPHADDILAASQDSLIKRTHKSTQSVWIMQALGYLLSALPDEEVLGKLLPLLSPHIQELDTLTKQTPDLACKPSVVHVVGLLTGLFSTLDLNKRGDGSERGGAGPTQPHGNPVVVVLQQVFPLIQTLLSKWLKDTEVVGAACAMFEKSVRTLDCGFAPLVPQLCELIGQLFSVYPQASVLDLTRQEHFRPIAALLEVITNITMSVFQRGVRDYPDMVDSFMQLHVQVLKRKPDLYLSKGLDIKVVFYCGILAFKFPEAPTLKSTCLLFTEVISHCEDVPAVMEVLEEDGTLLLHTLLEAMGGQAPVGLLELLADVVFSLGRHCSGLLPAQLREALLPHGFPSALLGPQQKDRFCQQVLREQVSKWRMRDIVKEFSLTCRGVPGMELATTY